MSAKQRLDQAAEGQEKPEQQLASALEPKSENKVRLKTTWHHDYFHVGDLTVTTSFAEFNESDARRIKEAAKRARVRIVEEGA